MTAAETRVLADTYLDSLLLLGASRAMLDADGVSWAAAVMATPANLETLAAEGFAGADLDAARANDLVLAVRADTAEAAAGALERGREALFSARTGESGEAAGPGPAPDRPSRTLEEASARAGSANVAVVSVPGPYAALEAHKALTLGLDTLLFSDNVPVEDEVELKERAVRLGRLLMGPGAGTARLGGVGLGFANAVRAGRVGVVAAAGTGAQEVMCLLDRWGPGVSHVVGVGGRDLSRAVGGRMTGLALAALDADPATDAILLVSKPPDEQVARALLGRRIRKPVVAVFLGMDTRAPGAEVAPTLESGAARIAARLGAPARDVTDGLRDRAEEAAAGLAAERTAVRGYFSGGTLCYEAQVILERLLGPVRSNAPLRPDRGLPARPGEHVCLDLGEEEYTRGRPHPMIDPDARTEMLRSQARDPDVAVVLLDVVLGYGAHPDPAEALAPACAEITADGGPRVVAYVLGTGQDPQGYDRQRATLEKAGCVTAPTAARAAHLAAAIAARDPGLAEVLP